jgi:transposase
MHLGEFPLPEAPEAPARPVAGHTRRTRMHRLRPDKDDAALFFDEARVPVETITVANPEIEGLTPTSTR